MHLCFGNYVKQKINPNLVGILQMPHQTRTTVERTSAKGTFELGQFLLSEREREREREKERERERERRE